jgi:hypothetical protein
MASRVLLDNEYPVTQSVESVKSLAAFLGVQEELPTVLSLDGVKLILSNKKDSYYTCTEKKCSCPAATYHSGPCKHIRKHFGVKPEATQESEEPLIKHGGFRPAFPG